MWSGTNPAGKFRGSLSNLTAVELGIRSVKELLNRCYIDPSSGVIDEVLFGQVLQAGAGQAPARQVALGAGLPNTIAATTINKVCGSSLKAVMMAANSIKAGEFKAIIAEEWRARQMLQSSRSAMVMRKKWFQQWSMMACGMLQ